jgi:CBS domain-containing protein
MADPASQHEEHIMPCRPISDIIKNQKLLHAPKTMCVSEAATLMRKNNVGAVAVLEQRRLVGIFTERDALFRVVAEHREPTQTHLDEVMTPFPQTIAPDRPFGHALHMMYEGGFRHVPVVDHGRIVGIVSARDALSSELAEFETEMGEREHIAEILG